MRGWLSSVRRAAAQSREEWIRCWDESGAQSMEEVSSPVRSATWRLEYRVPYRAVWRRAVGHAMYDEVHSGKVS